MGSEGGEVVGRLWEREEGQVFVENAAVVVGKC